MKKMTIENYPFPNQLLSVELVLYSIFNELLLSLPLLVKVASFIATNQRSNIY